MELMDVDLLRQQAKWKDILKEIRSIMTQVEQQGFTNLKTWRNHWDRQLYKALEHQYQVSHNMSMLFLNNLNKNSCPKNSKLKRFLMNTRANFQGKK